MSALFTTCGFPPSLNVQLTEGNQLQRYAEKTFGAFKTNNRDPEALQTLSSWQELTTNLANGKLPAAQVEYWGVASVNQSARQVDCAAEGFSAQVSLVRSGVAKFIEGNAALLFMAKLGLDDTLRYHPLTHIQSILTIGSMVGDQARRDAERAVGAVGAAEGIVWTRSDIRASALEVWGSSGRSNRCASGFASGFARGYASWCANGCVNWCTRGSK